MKNKGAVKLKEPGAASIFIELKDGIITVYHGEDNEVLAEWEGNFGDWEKLWERIEELRRAE